MALQHSGMLAAIQTGVDKNLWSQENLPDSVKQQKSAADAGKQSAADRKRAGNTGPRRQSIMPPKRQSAEEAAAEQDRLIMEHLSGTKDVFEDGDDMFLDHVFKTTLNEVQRTSEYFRGFSDNEIEVLFPFLTQFPFKDGDLLAAQGELHVTLRRGAPYESWNVVTLARLAGLR